jgi:hypothetical protein
VGITNNAFSDAPHDEMGQPSPPVRTYDEEMVSPLTRQIGKFVSRTPYPNYRLDLEGLTARSLLLVQCEPASGAPRSDSG